MKAFRFQICLLVCLLMASCVEATYLFVDGGFVNSREAPTESVYRHYELAVDAYEKEEWKEAAKQFNIIAKHFSESALAQEALFFLGIANYNLQEYDFANLAFTEYLSGHGCPEHFDEAIEYKFAVAEQFRGGAKRHMFNTKHMPRWASGDQLALQIYDEVIAAAPSQEISARALFSKGLLLWQLKDYRESVDSFHLIIRRFPKHELAPESYLTISKIHLEQCEVEFQNPDLLAFAQMNLQKFERDFPSEERLSEVSSDVTKIKEIYARGLYETATFYERTGHSKAAAIYYQSAMAQFPGTIIANYCQRRLDALAKKES